MFDERIFTGMYFSNTKCMFMCFYLRSYLIWPLKTIRYWYNPGLFFSIFKGQLPAVLSANFNARSFLRKLLKVLKSHRVGTKLCKHILTFAKHFLSEIQWNILLVCICIEFFLILCKPLVNSINKIIKKIVVLCNFLLVFIIISNDDLHVLLLLKNK